MSTCPTCGKPTWHKTTAAVVEKRAIYENVVGDDGTVTKMKVGENVTVLKPSEVRKHTCKRHSPPTQTHDKKTRPTGWKRHTHRRSTTHAR